MVSVRSGRRAPCALGPHDHFDGDTPVTRPIGAEGVGALGNPGRVEASLPSVGLLGIERVS